MTAQKTIWRPREVPIIPPQSVNSPEEAQMQTFHDLEQFPAVLAPGSHISKHAIHSQN